MNKTPLCEVLHKYRKEKAIVARTTEITHLYQTGSLHSSCVSQLELSLLGGSLIPCTKATGSERRVLTFRGKTTQKYFSGGKRCVF